MEEQNFGEASFKNVLESNLQSRSEFNEASKDSFDCMPAHACQVVGGKQKETKKDPRRHYRHKKNDTTIKNKHIINNLKHNIKQVESMEKQQSINPSYYLIRIYRVVVIQ